MAGTSAYQTFERFASQSVSAPETPGADADADAEHQRVPERQLFRRHAEHAQQEGRVPAQRGIADEGAEPQPSAVHSSTGRLMNCQKVATKPSSERSPRPVRA